MHLIYLTVQTCNDICNKLACEVKIPAISPTVIPRLLGYADISNEDPLHGEAIALNERYQQMFMKSRERKPKSKIVELKEKHTNPFQDYFLEIIASRYTNIKNSKPNPSIEIVLPDEYETFANKSKFVSLSTLVNSAAKLDYLIAPSEKKFTNLLYAGLTNKKYPPSINVFEVYTARLRMKEAEIQAAQKILTEQWSARKVSLGK